MPLINGYPVMDDSYIDSQFHIPSYSELHTQPEIVIHLNLSAAQLSLTPEELAPILRERQLEYYLRDEVAQPLTQPAIYNTTKVELQQPPPKPALYVHPQSIAAQSGLSLTEIAEIEEDCIHEQTEWLAIEEAKQKVCKGELRGKQEESRGDETEEIEEAPGMGLEQHQDETSTAQSGPNCTVAIKPLMLKCAVLGVARGDWAVEMEEEMGLTLQGEYIQDPHSPAPSPAPWYPHNPLQ
jgi:hypothetical protein